MTHVAPPRVTALLPGLYQDDPGTGLLAGALDELLAPFVSTLDCLDAYLDPRVAPADFVDWLATLVAADVAADWTVDRRRDAVSSASDRHALRGTAAGLVRAVEAATGVRVDVSDGGGVTVATSPGAPAPGSGTDVVTILVPADAGEDVTERVAAAAAAALPAHLRLHVRTCKGDQP